MSLSNNSRFASGGINGFQRNFPRCMAARADAQRRRFDRIREREDWAAQNRRLAAWREARGIEDRRRLVIQLALAGVGVLIGAVAVFGLCLGAAL